MKITRNELRLGNLIEYANVLCKVESINYDGTITSDGVEAPYDAFNGVVLSQDILYLFGFKHDDIGGFLWMELLDPDQYIELWHNYDNSDDDDGEFGDGDEDDIDNISDDSYEYFDCYLTSGDTEDEDYSVIDPICTKSIVYVHELQNLYFALTGEELTLN